MTRLKSATKVAKAFAALAALLTTTGCSMDDVEFNGGVFNAIGIGSGSETKAPEPKIAARTGLVVPPNLERLPDPGAVPQGEPADLALIDDPDRKAQVTQADLERQQAEYCHKNYEMAIAHGDRTSAELATGPLGPCRGSVLTAIKKYNGQDVPAQE